MRKLFLFPRLFSGFVIEVKKHGTIVRFLTNSFFLMMSAMLVIASGLLDNCSWLALFWMLPMLAVLPKVSPAFAAISAGFCASLFWMGSVHWMLSATHTFTQAPLLVVAVLFFLVCLFLAIPYMAFGWLYASWRLHKTIGGSWLGAACLTVLIMLFPSPLPGLPEHALHNFPRLLAILDISGVAMVIFASAVWQMLLIQAISMRGMSRIKALLLCMAIALLVAGYGIYRNDQYQAEKAAAPPQQWVDIAYIQPAFQRNDSTDSLYTLSTQLLAGYKPDLLVWPEFPPAFSLVDNQMDRKNTLSMSREYGLPMLAVSGYVYAKPVLQNRQRPYYNAAHLIKNGEIQSTYYKQRLVPFFEFMPGKSIFPAMANWFPLTLNYLPGNQSLPFEFNAGVRLIPAICYEGVFPGLVSEFVRQGGNILINPVSDTWFGNSAGSRYHASLTYFRTMEHHIPWLRVANTGITMAVEANGDIMPYSVLPVGKVAVGKQRLFIPARRSVYSRFGDVLTPLLCIVILIAVGSRWRSRIGKSFKEKKP